MLEGIEKVAQSCCRAIRSSSGHHEKVNEIPDSTKQAFIFVLGLHKITSLHEVFICGVIKTQCRINKHYTRKITSVNSDSRVT